jgi:tetratricopeptide (TPR) repeat protein
MLIFEHRASGLRRAAAALMGSVLVVCSCSEVRGRHLLQKANQQYRDGQYAEALATFNAAERLVPDLWLLWLNKGYTCRSMLVPGAKTPENQTAMTCSLEAFTRLQALRPDDQRGQALYVQTLFDAEQFESLVNLFRARLQREPENLESVTGLIQVYSRWPNHMSDALEWHRRKLQLRPKDPEAYYSAGVYIWQQLFARGGGPEMAAFDPRPDPDKRKQVKVPPASAPSDLVGQQRVDLADEGLGLLENARELRQRYPEAMAYANLLYRQRSFAYFHDPEEWQRCVDKAAEWRNKAVLAMGKTLPAEDGTGKSAGKR